MGTKEIQKTVENYPFCNQCPGYSACIKMSLVLPLVSLHLGVLQSLSGGQGKLLVPELCMCQVNRPKRARGGAPLEESRFSLESSNEADFLGGQGVITRL